MRARPHLVLASGSPRRHDLLGQIGIDFEVRRPASHESTSPCLSIRELTTLNATRKGLEIARVCPDAVVLAADTLVALDGRTVGKPADHADAVRILKALNGRAHQVCTSVFICAAARGQKLSFHVFSHVQFRTLSERKIEAYLARINPLDKAGAYAAQADGAEIIEEIRGSYTNVVGLPMDETVTALRSFGIRPARLRAS